MFAMNALPTIHSGSVFEAIRDRTVLLLCFHVHICMYVCMYTIPSMSSNICEFP